MKWHEPEIFEQPDGSFIWEVVVSHCAFNGDEKALKIRSDVSFPLEDLAVADCARYIEEFEIERLNV